MRSAELAPLPRSHGELRLSVRRRDAATVIDSLYQQGSGKLRFPRLEPGEPLQAVTLNTSGGLTDGDRFVQSMHWGANTQAIVTTQAAERVYRSRAGEAEVVNTLRVDAGARAVWLPQELILFDGARLRRRAEAQLDANASLFLAETWTLGRAAMGEVVRSGALFDRWRIYRGDALVWADGFALDSDDVGDLQAHIEQAAVLNANRALMSAVLVCDDPQRFVEAIRNALRAPSSHRLEAAVTHVGAALVVRAVSDNARWLRAALHRVVDALGSDAQDGNPLSGCRLPTVFHY